MSGVLLVTHVVQWWSGDRADRLIYATAVEHGLKLVSKDARLRKHGRSVAVW